MKNIFILMIFSTLILSSCGDDFLLVNPTNQIFASEYYDSQERLEKALVAAYNPLLWPDFYQGQYCPIPFMSDAMSDDVLVGGADQLDGVFFHAMAAFDLNSQLNPVSLWAVMYTGVNRANTVIEKLSELPDTKINTSDKERINGEAHFLRAYYYYWLWKFWGNIPYYDKNPDEMPYLVDQISADEVYKHIVEDLDIVIQSAGLPDKIEDVLKKGRVTKDAARMLKAQTVMYQNDATKYAEVLADMKSIITSNRYNLFSDFAKLWQDEGEHCVESIWEINYSDAGNRGWDRTTEMGGTIYPQLIGINASSGQDFTSGWGFEPVLKSFYDSYDNSDKRKNGGILNFDYYKATVRPSATYTPRYQNTGYFNLKYIGRTGYTSNYTGQFKELNFRNNLRVFRFAETLLIASELALKVPGEEGNAQVYLDRVRERAFGNNTNSIAATVENILEENHKEFALEGHRYWDLIRTGNAEAVLGSKGYTPNKKYFPIPQSEIDKSFGTLTPNKY